MKQIILQTSKEIKKFLIFKHEFNNNLNTLEYIENNNLDLYTPYEGYIRGNLFKNMYDQYKNFQPGKIKINSEQEEMLLNIGQMAFAAHELNLLLDNYLIISISFLPSSF